MQFYFVEKGTFTRHVTELLSTEEYFALQTFLLEFPTFGKVVPQLECALRKVRWHSAGRGKRGGVRVIYSYSAGLNRIIFLAVWAKNEREDLTRRAYNELCDFLREFQP